MMKLIQVYFVIKGQVHMKNGVFWDVMLYGSCMNRRFGGTYHLHHQGDVSSANITHVKYTAYLMKRQMHNTVDLAISIC
jgi:hypothetical protein